MTEGSQEMPDGTRGSYSTSSSSWSNTSPAFLASSSSASASSSSSSSEMTLTRTGWICTTSSSASHPGQFRISPSSTSSSSTSTATAHFGQLTTAGTSWSQGGSPHNPAYYIPAAVQREPAECPIVNTRSGPWWASAAWSSPATERCWCA